MAELAHDASGSSEAASIALQASGPASSDKGKLRVFISYSRDDLHFADQLDAALNAYGFECLIDRHGISGGEEWKQRLRLANSRAVGFLRHFANIFARSHCWAIFLFECHN